MNAMNLLDPETAFRLGSAAAMSGWLVSPVACPQPGR